MATVPATRRRRSRIVFSVHRVPEYPATQRSQPSQHVVHVAEIHQLDQIAVEVPDKEERMAARGALRLAQALDTLALQEIVPALQVADVERDVSQADTVPRYRVRRQLRLERKNFEHCPSRHADPADFAAAVLGIDAEKRSHPIWGRIGD